MEKRFPLVNPNIGLGGESVDSRSKIISGAVLGPSGLTRFLILFETTSHTKRGDLRETTEGHSRRRQ